MKKTINKVYLIGAGFTKNAFPDAPLNDDLLSILNGGGLSNNILFNKLKNQYDTDDIEQFLTYLDIDTISKKKPELTSLREDINKELAEYFRKFRFSNYRYDEDNWVLKFAKDMLRKNDLILTLNYDCFLEGAMWKAGVWSPNGGYSQYINNTICPSTIGPNEELKNIVLYKLHGSENFMQGDIIGASNKSMGKEHFWVCPLIDDSIFSNIKAHLGACDSQSRGPYIIAPSYIKMPHVQIGSMWTNALRLVSKATRLCVMGCSLREEDMLLKLLLTAFVYKNEKSFGDEIDTDKEFLENKVLIIDPEAKRLEKLLKEKILLLNQFSAAPHILSVEMSIEEYVKGEEMKCLREMF